MPRALVCLGLAALCACSALPQVNPVAAKTAVATAPAARAPASPPLSFPLETYALPNGMTVVLMEDHSAPRVVIDTWFGVGSKDEPPGRSGFAHLFEHLMFMGTKRVPGAQFDLLMERGGGSNNASTGSDRTNYYSMGPPELLPTLLWLDAERLDALADSMTQEKLDRQRDIVRNERRQSYENVPYGKAAILVGEALYPPEHPYHNPVIGSHQDLEAAKLPDVVDFFRKFYSPANATLVVAGDFESAAVKPLVERYFGALAKRGSPAPRVAEPVRLEREVQLVEYDRVEFPKLQLTWHSPAQYAAGDAELDLLSSILAGGSSSRLERRLVLEKRLAQRVSAGQDSSELGSLFSIEVIGAPGAELSAIKSETLAVLDELLQEGPSADELARAQALAESGFRRSVEGLLGRAERVQSYRKFLGVSDGFQRDLERYTSATPVAVRDAARSALGPGRLDLRVYPQGEAAAASALDKRPTDFSARPAALPQPTRFELSNGIAVHVLPRAGSGLFSATLVVGGGEGVIPAQEMGSAPLAARWLDSGAGGRDKSQFSAAVEALGARLRTGTSRTDVSFDLSGLSSRLPESLDLLADLVLRPNLTETDFARERDLLSSAIRARDDNPGAVAANTSRALLFGAQDPRGRPLEGSLESVARLTRESVAARLPALLQPKRASFVFAGDLDVAALRPLLEARFAGWTAAPVAVPPAPAPLTEPPAGRIVFVHREQAPQTVIQIMRPLTPAEGAERAVRSSVNTMLGGSFTSRLNQNLREDKGYTYGARSQIGQEGPQFLLTAGASVVTKSTGPALTEFRKEFKRLASGDISPDELGKAVELGRSAQLRATETTTQLSGALAALVRNGRPLDAWTGDLAALASVDLPAATRLARSGLYDWDRLLIVLVGDRSAILPQLAAAGFPKPIEVNSQGRPVSPSGSAGAAAAHATPTQASVKAP